MKVYSRITALLIIFIFGYLASCAQKIADNQMSPLINQIKSDSIFTVLKIDSINNYYLIYAKRKNQWFKIVSKKDNILIDSRIKISNDYKFSLHSIWNEKIMIGGINVSPSQTPHVTCLGFDKETTVCIERDSINDLFITKNLKGLKYIK